MAAKARLSRRRCYGALCIITNSTLIQRIMAEFLFKSCDLIYSSIREQRNPIVRLQRSKPNKNHLNSCLNSSIAPKFRPLNISWPGHKGHSNHTNPTGHLECVSQAKAQLISLLPSLQFIPFLSLAPGRREGDSGRPSAGGEKKSAR